MTRRPKRVGLAWVAGDSSSSAAAGDSDGDCGAIEAASPERRRGGRASAAEAQAPSAAGASGPGQVVSGTLIVARYQADASLVMGSVRAGGAGVAGELRLLNPGDAPVELAVDKVCAERGFSLDAAAWQVPPHAAVTAIVRWAPPATEAVGNVREKLHFKFDGKHRLAAVVYGTVTADPSAATARAKVRGAERARVSCAAGR